MEQKLTIGVEVKYNKKMLNCSDSIIILDSVVRLKYNQFFLSL